MPAPSSYTYSEDAVIAANTSFLALLDAGSGAAKIRLRDDSDNLLSEVPLTDPAGTVNGTTGQLTLTPSGPDPSAALGGVCTYGEICDSDNNVKLALPAQQGPSAVSGVIVVDSTTIVQGAEVNVLTCLIG